MTILERKNRYQTLADQNKLKSVGYALGLGVCSLGIIGLQSLKKQGIDLDDGFLQTVNWVIEPILGIGAGASALKMIEKILNNIHYNKLIVEADKIIEIEERNSMGGR